MKDTSFDRRRRLGEGNSPRTGFVSKKVGKKITKASSLRVRKEGITRTVRESPVEFSRRVFDRTSTNRRRRR